MTEAKEADQSLFEHVVDLLFTSGFAIVAIGIYTLPVTLSVHSVFNSVPNFQYVAGLTVVTWGLYVAQLTINAGRDASEYRSELRQRLNRWANVVYHNTMIAIAMIGGALLLSAPYVSDVGVLFAMLVPTLHHELFVRRNIVRSPLVSVITWFFTRLAQVLEQVPEIRITEPELGAVPNLDGWVQRYQNRRTS